MAFSNVYNRRQVAATAAKPCYICYKPTDTVLNQEDGKDWFYVCPGHLSDRGFAIPLVSAEEEAAKRKKEELEREIEKVKEEYAEKMKKKKGKNKEKDKEVEKKKEELLKKDESEMDDKVKELEAKKSEASKDANSDGTRTFNLHKSIYQMRITRIKNSQQAKRIQARLQDPASFPTVPTGKP